MFRLHALSPYLLAACFLSACGGGGGESTPQVPNDPGSADACAVLCISNAAATNVAVFKGEATSLSASAAGTASAAATYQWDLGDGSAIKTGANVANYVYANPGMYRIKVTATSKDANQAEVTASKMFQVNVIRPQTVMLSKSDVFAIDTSGKLMYSASSKGSRFGVPADSFVAKNFKVGYSGNVKSIGGCNKQEDCPQTFAIVDAEGSLMGAGNDKDDFEVATSRSTGVGNDKALTFQYSRAVGGTQLNRIKKTLTTYGQGKSNSYALRGDGALFGAGSNGDGQLGIGQASGTAAEVFTLAKDAQGALAGVVDFAVGPGKAYVLKTDGTVWAAGSNNPGVGGSLGIASNTLDDQIAFVPVKDNAGNNLSGVKEIYCDPSGSAFALRWDGSLWVAGANATGKLGLGTTAVGDLSKGFQPALLSSGQPVSNVKSVVVLAYSSASHAMLIMKDGSLLFAGNGAEKYSLAASDVTPTFPSSPAAPDRTALKFSAVRYADGTPITKVAAVSQASQDFMFILDQDGVVYAHGKTGALGTHGVTAPNKPWELVALNANAVKVRYANFKGAKATNRDVIGTVPDADSDLNYGYIDDAAQPMLLALASNGGGCSVTLGRNGELYATGSSTSCNHYAREAFTPMFPANDGLRFKTGLE